MFLQQNGCSRPHPMPLSYRSILDLRLSEWIKNKEATCLGSITHPLSNISRGPATCLGSITHPLSNISRGPASLIYEFLGFHGGENLDCVPIVSSFLPGRWRPIDFSETSVIICNTTWRHTERSDRTVSAPAFRIF
jgi:hypothetical protein